MTENKTWAEAEAERKAAKAAFMATEPTAEELGRIREGELGAERRETATFAIGGSLDGYSRTIARNVFPENVDYELRSLAQNERLTNLHAYPEAF